MHYGPLGPESSSYGIDPLQFEWIGDTTNLQRRKRMRRNLIWISILFICVAAGCSSKPKAGQAPVPPSGAAAGAGAPAGATAPAATATNSPASPANGKAPAQATSAPAAAPAAKPSAGTGKPQITCVRDSDERLMEIVESQPKGCSLYYTKSGERSSIASSSHASSHCESVRDRIKKNLEDAGYKCGDQAAKVAGPQAPAKAETKSAN